MEKKQVKLDIVQITAVGDRVVALTKDGEVYEIFRSESVPKWHLLARPFADIK